MNGRTPVLLTIIVSRRMPWRTQTIEKSAVNNRENTLSGEVRVAESPGSTADPAVREHIRELVDKQPYAVLCVQGMGQPYGALVAIAFSEDLRHAAFVTPIATRKYRLLSECEHIALVIDNRSCKSGELMEIEAVTVTGRSENIEHGDEFNHWAGLLTARHPYLESYVNAATCALFRIDVGRYLHVARLQDVNQWTPGSRS